MTEKDVEIKKRKTIIYTNDNSYGGIFVYEPYKQVIDALKQFNQWIELTTPYGNIIFNPENISRIEEV